jgi:hypothetical protein
MQKRTFLLVMASLLALASVAGIVGAQSSAGFDLSWHVLGGGATQSSSGDFAMNGTAGQAIVFSSDGTSLKMQHGYWGRAYEPILYEHSAYLPVVFRDHP